MDNVVLTDLGEGDSVNKGVLVEMSLGGDDRWHGKNAETAFSDAITMQAEARWRAEERKRKQKELEGIEAVALADAGDEDARRRLSLYHEHWGWTQLDVALHDREHRDEVLGDGLARVYGTGDPGAVWDAMNASADYEYEQMPVWNTRAEGMRLVWQRFQKMAAGKKAAADAAQKERENAFTGVFRELVLEGSGVKKSGDAWGRFYDGLARGVFRKEDEVAVRRAADAWGMMEGVLGDGTDAGANVLTQGSTGQLIMERLRGDELAQGLFFSALQARVQDMRTSEQERSFFVRFARAFEAADKLLVAGLMGGHFRAFVSDEEVEAYNAEREKLRESTGVERPNVALLADGDSWFERVLPLGNKRLEAVHKAARESGQLNEDGSLRRMSEEERVSTQVLNEFRGRLFNAVNGVYDVPGVAARFGKMLPGSLLYVVPGGAPASFGSMRTQYMANELAEGKSWAMASSSGAVNAAIQAAVEKIAFGSLNPGKMVPGMDWLMSRPVMARALGGLYGSTAGRVGMGVALGGAEETFLEPAAGLILGGVYNAVAGTEMQLDSPLEEYRKEMEEMLKPDQLLATALYGLLLGGVSVGAQMDAAESYRKVRRRLLDVGVDEGRAAQVARMENAVERMQAVQGLIDERLKVDAAGVLGYVAELYPQLQEMATVENYFDKGMLPKVLPAEESGMVKVQERDAEGNVQESVMSEDAARLLVEARMEELNGQEQAEMAEMALANAMVGAVSKDGKRWAVSVEDAEMNHEYFERLARAAGVRLSEGARADEVDPNVHPFVPLGQLVGHGEAWEQRMKVARHEYEQKNGAVSDAQWEKVARRMVSRVNRTGVRGADGRLRTVLRVARGGFGTMEVLEDVTEDNLVRDMEVNGRSLDFYVNNIRELEAAMGKPGAFLRELKDGESEYDRLAVVEAMGKLVQSKVLADTARKGNGLSAALNAFLDLIRSWVLQAKALMKLGAMLNKALSDKETMEKLAPEFLGDVDRLVAQDVEWLQSLQLKEGLEAMQRVYAAQAEAKADRKVKRRKRVETPVLDRAMAQKGDEVGNEVAEKAKLQAEADADAEAAEAALEGDFSSSVFNQDELEDIKAAAVKNGTFMKAPNGEPSKLTEWQWLQVRTGAFKDWFGDWENDPENASKAVDENGEPKVYYHHTNAEFTEFLHSKRGKTDAGWLGAGFYFYGIEDEGKGYGKNVMECFLNVREPYYASDDDMFRLSEADSIEESEAFTESLIEDGYDGVYYDGDLRQEMLLFDSSQIKSATDNRGTFDGGNADITFSVIGPKAKTWDRYKHRAFTGRDDGMQRAEIDASQAKLKWEDLRGKNVTAYRRMVAGWDKLPEDVRKAVEAYAEKAYDYQDESQKLNNTPEEAFLEQYNTVIKLRDALKPQREEVRTLLNKLFVEYGGSAAAVLNIKDAELDELAMSLWGPYVESKVERMLDLRPLWNGGMKLADVLEYPELYEAYPELADITVRYATMDNAYGRALYQDEEHEILINRNLEGEWRSIHSILLHEIQHHIQNIEGFAKGGNPSYARRLVDNRAAMGDADALALREHSDMELYHRIAGEIEARNVQARYGWPMDRREGIPFNDTLEYPGEVLVTFSVQRKRDLTLDGEHVTQKQAWEHLAELEGKPLRNARSKFVAVVNKPQRKELTNDNKAKMSAENGFSKGAHYAAVSRIESLFAHAVPCGEYPDLKHGEPTVHIHRFACPMMIDGEKAVAWLTAKQTTNVEGSERLYNLELVDIEKLAVTLEYLASHRLDTALRPASADIVAEVEEAFKTYFEDEPDVGSNFSASLTGAAAAGRRVLEYPGEALVTFSVQSVTADWKNTLHGYLNNPPLPGTPAHTHDMVVCPTPAVMQMVGAKGWDMVVTPGVLDKVMKGKHAVSVVALEQLPAAMADPICIAVSDTPGCLEVVTELKEGQHNVLVAVQLSSRSSEKKEVKVNRIASMYGKERIASLLSHPMLYWDKAKARIWMQAYRLQLPAQVLPKRASGRKILKPADLVKYKEQHGMSFSMINPDVEALAGEVVAAGQGFRANLAFSNQIVKEMRDSLQRMKRLGSKSRTEREDAIAAMGTMVHVVKAAVAYLPKGYRFSVHPYLKKLEVLAELATTGNLELTAELNDFATRPIKEFVRVQQGLHDVVEMKGQGELETDMSVEELLKEYGEAKLTDAMERIMHRVAEQLRKHAKDKAVQKITDLVERLRPKKDKKTGKLKGGKMSADSYRDLDDVYEAMNMSAEELVGKLAVLNEKLNKPGISEDERMQAEGELMLYDQFGDLKGMSAEGAVEAYEALRQRVWFHRFEWENVMAERRAMRRAVVRRVVDGVGSVSENEYNAKKRRVKPVKRLRHLGDILAGLPAVLRGLHGYLPLRGLAQDLTLRANRAGEQLKAWESERWVALEALSRETMGKSWRLCMDDMHEVKPTGVAFDRPKYRTVSYRTDGLRVLLEMTPEERKTEMRKRREAGGKEAETVLTERDVEALAEKLVQLEAEVSEAESKHRKVPATIEVRYLEEMQHEENLELSRGEALYAILMYEQPTYTERMEAQGYTPEVIEGLRRFVGEGMLEFGYGLRELFAKQGDRVAAVYERVYGVPFPREENYFAARWDVTEVKGSPAEQLLAGMSGTPGAGKGWQKQRVNHDLELDMTKDALQVFLQATSLTDTWMATQDIVEDFKAWTRDKDFVKALTVLLGKDGYDNLIDWIRILELGGVQDCLNMGASQDVINGIYGSGAVAILGFRVQTLLKQVPSIFNGLLGAHDISTAEWFATLSRMKNRTAPMTFRKMLGSTLLENRMQGRAGVLKGQAMRSGDMRSSMAEKLLLASMLPMEWTDACCTAVSLVPVWNVYYQRAIEKNASVQEAERMAWEQTAEVANLSSQPIGWLNKSKIAQLRNPLVRTFFYMLSENTAKVAMARALWKSGKKMAAFRAWLVYGAANAAISALLDYLQGDPEKWEKGEWWEYLLAMFYGPMAGIPGVGELLEAATTVLLQLGGEALDIEWMKKVKARASVGRAMIDFQGSWRAVAKIWEFATDDKEHGLSEYTRAMGTVSRTLAIGTGWMGNAVGYWNTVVAVLMNPIDFGARIRRNMKEYYGE